MGGLQDNTWYIYKQKREKSRSNALIQLLYRSDDIPARRADKLLTQAIEEVSLERMTNDRNPNNFGEENICTSSSNDEKKDTKQTEGLMEGTHTHAHGKLNPKSRDSVDPD